MSTLHALFPVKLLSILNLFVESKRGTQEIYRSSQFTQVQLPEDGRLRSVMSSPPLFDVINDPAVQRIRLAFVRNDMLQVYKTSLEMYSATGELLSSVSMRDWSMILSLAIEAELLERILDVNPL